MNHGVLQQYAEGIGGYSPKIPMLLAIFNANLQNQEANVTETWGKGSNRVPA